LRQSTLRDKTAYPTLQRRLMPVQRFPMKKALGLAGFAASAVRRPITRRSAVQGNARSLKIIMMLSGTAHRLSRRRDIPIVARRACNFSDAPRQR
jgi:hypothetical protein